MNRKRIHVLAGIVMAVVVVLALMHHVANGTLPLPSLPHIPNPHGG